MSEHAEDSELLAQLLELGMGDEQAIRQAIEATRGGGV